MSEAWLGRIGAATSISSAAKYSQGERLNATHFNSFANLRRVTSSPIGHILTNAQVWSADGKWIYFDVRSDRHGGVFDGREIRRVHVQTGEENVVYRAVGQACCGVVLAHPLEEKIVFIHGPEYPNRAWSYGAARRGGVVLVIGQSIPERLDARDMSSRSHLVHIGVDRTCINFRPQEIGSVLLTKMSISKHYFVAGAKRKRINAT